MFSFCIFGCLVCLASCAFDGPPLDSLTNRCSCSIHCSDDDDDSDEDESEVKVQKVPAKPTIKKVSPVILCSQT